jgi:hypothetical protein
MCTHMRVSFETSTAYTYGRIHVHTHMGAYTDGCPLRHQLHTHMGAYTYGRLLRPLRAFKFLFFLSAGGREERKRLAQDEQKKTYSPSAQQAACILAVINKKNDQ